ncbi:MAG: hypothetical protein LLG05_14010, partial [Porphyromonadaceae bacterium]|nr:hypothetical protein [Porphyromonadaceae bacterium]
KARKAPAPAPAASQSVKAHSQRMSYKEQRALEAIRQELAELPAHIEALETEQHRLSVAMADPTFYQRGSAEIAQTASRMKELEEELAQAYQRWEEIDALEG